ncbi:hypothetical protein [Afipia felis]|uniref:hypothetical protein n=1 Tax=Afipia felis TaxID=1035 RepID=UPI000590B43B|nr:hypothetical protein [Afipia felis]
MSSLTAFLPHIANEFEMSVHALYERQRALVRLGLLPRPVGRGRGSGAEATPGTVALLIISVLATDNLSDTDERIKKLAEAKLGPDNSTCALTGERTFLGALAAALASETIARKVSSIEVSRRASRASLFYLQGRTSWAKETSFGRSREILQFEVHADLHGGAIGRLCKALTATRATR